MRAVVISNPEGASTLLRRAQDEGYITFVYSHADPLEQLGLRKFMYISSDEELTEKLALLSADHVARDEVTRW